LQSNTCSGWPCLQAEELLRLLICVCDDDGATGARDVTAAAAGHVTMFKRFSSLVSVWLSLRLPAPICSAWSVLFFSRPRSEARQHHERTFSIYYRAMLSIHGTSHRPVSVRPFVCPSQVGVLSKRLNELSWFLACELPSTRPIPCFKEIQVCAKIRVLPLELFCKLWT